MCWFVRSHANCHIVYYNMRAWDNNATNNNRRINLAFPTHKWNVSNSYVMLFPVPSSNSPGKCFNQCVLPLPAIQGCYFICFRWNLLMLLMCVLSDLIDTCFHWCLFCPFILLMVVYERATRSALLATRLSKNLNQKQGCLKIQPRYTMYQLLPQDFVFLTE